MATASVVQFQQPQHLRLSPGLQMVSESLMQVLSQKGPMARGKVWQDRVGRLQYDFRLYSTQIDEGKLLEIRLTSIPDPDSGFNLNFIVHKDRSITDSLDFIIEGWKEEKNNFWVKKIPRVMMEKRLGLGYKVPSMFRSHNLFEIMLERLQNELDIVMYFYNDDPALVAALIKLQEALETWYPKI